MPILDLYKKILNDANSIGEAHKRQSDQIIESTWYNDISAKTAYLYDQDHDDEFGLMDDLHPNNPVRKFLLRLSIMRLNITHWLKMKQHIISCLSRVMCRMCHITMISLLIHWEQYFR